MNNTIPLSFNPIDTLLLKEVLDAYHDRDHGDIISDFEKAIANYTGSRYVVALNSGTAALHLALKAHGVGHNDEVLTSTFTYVGSVNPVLYLDARPVFIDSDSSTWNLDVDLLETALRSRPKKPAAILVVHSFGMPAAMDRIMRLSKEFEVPVIEDAAEAIGSSFCGQHLGTIGHAGVLSFNNNKTITTYGGGAVLTNDEGTAKKIRYWAGQARDPKPYYEHREVGFSYRMGPLNAAAGLAALKTVDARISSNRAKFERYRDMLAALTDFEVADEPEGYHSNRWLSAVFCSKEGFDVLGAVARFRDAGIEVRPFWNPMHFQPAFAQFDRVLNGQSERLFKGGLCLPSSYDLNYESQIQVMAVLRNL